MQPNKDENQFTPVMDVQRPSSTMPPSRQPTVVSPSGPLGRPATMEYTRPRPDDPSTPSFAPEPQPQSTQFSAPQKQKKSKKGLVIAIFVVLFLGLAAAGAGYYYFALYNKSEPAPAQNAQPAPAETESTAIEATPEGVDNATEQIDQQLNSLDDTQDFTNNDVSDDGLGL